jgi:arylsulfatase A-like enzyme
LAVNTPWIGRSGLNRYADFVLETDAAVGKILDALDKTGQGANTLVIFTSDNGCAPYIGVKELEQHGHNPSGQLRGYKSDVWEGGHRVPFIVRWPSVVQPGQVCDQLVHQADLMATCADILNISLPENAAEDSFSLLPLLTGSQKPIRETTVSTSIRGLAAVRRNHWKLIFGPGAGGWSQGSDDQPGQLYNLDDDRGEKNNLYRSRPDLVAELTACMERLVDLGRSTPGSTLQNDVPVTWKKHHSP